MGLPGITPARAGNSFIACRCFVIPMDHPRACGEQILPGCVPVIVAGSPPRVRGTVYFADFCFNNLRITPARAGNRRCCSGCRPAGGDHPRACGEQVSQALRMISCLGSPPRVRGTAMLQGDCYGIYGITPARAGNSPEAGRTRGQCKDHPRACGEQAASPLLMVLCKGSPPRVRGTGRLDALQGRPGRITPARAGNSTSGIHPGPYAKDHPRACGEQCTTQRAIDSVKGSPPRVRGTALIPVVSRNSLRITPARAGNRIRCGY